VRLILFRCNAGRRIGLGHFVRCLALAEEFQARRVPVHFVSEFIDDPWPIQQLASHGLSWQSPANPSAAALCDLAAHRRASVIFVDWYDPDAAFFNELASRGFLVAALDDLGERELPVDIAVNQNIGAEALPHRTRPDTIRLLGVSFALLRETVREKRATAARRAFPDQARRVLAMMGGTDPLGLTPPVVEALLQTGLPLAIRAVTTDARRVHALHSLRVSPEQRITVLTHVDNVAEAFLWSDLTVSAAGSTCWELACLRTPMALVLTADNQRVIYDNLVAGGAAIGLGDGRRLDAAHLAPVFRALLLDAAQRTRLSDAAGALVDGDGRRRVADAILAEINNRRRRR
jgi:UDP-2,4-diacetamido-2,4,6-trideoxy-beta-L-altropyranose hydrolase